VYRVASSGLQSFRQRDRKQTRRAGNYWQLQILLFRVPRACTRAPRSPRGGNARDITRRPPPVRSHRRALSSPPPPSPAGRLMTRARCRQRGALRTALFLLPRAFYRHPLLIAVVPHRLGRESIYRRRRRRHHRTATSHLEEIRWRVPAGFPRLNSRLTAANLRLTTRLAPIPPSGIPRVKRNKPRGAVLEDSRNASSWRSSARVLVVLDARSGRYS